MDSLPEVDDLRLVAAVAATGSIGAAARRLRISQPSASQRLARLERRVGVPLFDRDTQGATPTPAGHELAHQADHILGHLAHAFDSARVAAERARLRVGVFPSLVAEVLPALELILDTELDQYVDHGDRLLAWLAEGTLDAAVIAIAEQVDVAAGLRVHRVGRDRLALLLPPGITVGSGRQPLRDRRVVFATYDAGAETVRRGLIGLGADVHRAATVPTALATGRLRGWPTAVPASAVRDRLPGEKVRDLPLAYRIEVSMVLPRRPDQRLADAVPKLRRELGLA